MEYSINVDKDRGVFINHSDNVCWLEEETMQIRRSQKLENNSKSEIFFRPWERSTNQQSNVAVVRPFHLYPSVFSSHSHKKILREEEQQSNGNNNSIISDPEFVILNRPLFLESTNELTKCKQSKDLSRKRKSKDIQLTFESESSSDLIICENENNKQEMPYYSNHIIMVEGESEKNESNSEPLDLRTIKLPYVSCADYQISIIRSLSPVQNKILVPTIEAVKEKKSRKFKIKRKICTACNRTYLKTRNLRWHFKSKRHYMRVLKLGIEDPANQPNTWYKINDQNATISENSR